MDAIDLLTTRRSSKQLQAPAPDAAQLRLMVQAAMQVPDHGLLLPYRFVVIRGDAALQRLADTLHTAAQAMALGEEGEKKAQRVAGMAPLVIGVVATPQVQGAIPVWEQLLTAGCSVYAMQLAAKAQGFDSVWLSGRWLESEALREGFACVPDEQIIALLMVGTAKSAVDGAKNTDVTNKVLYW